MARASQAALERAYYQDFSRYCPLAPKGEITFSDKPDILVTGSDLLGIEVANVYHRDGKDQSSEQIQSKLRSEVIRQAETLYLAGKNPEYEFWVDFDPNIPITNTRELSQRVYNCVLQAIQAQEHTSDKGFDDCPELRFMTYNGIEYPNARWRSLQSHNVPILSVERVLEIIASKTAKSASYQSCDRYWLLLIVDFWDPAQDQQLTWNPAVRTGPTPFERIIIYKPATRDWLEIPK